MTDPFSYTSLSQAVRDNNLEPVRDRLKEDEDPSATQGHAQDSLLYTATKQGDLELVKLLLQYGANPNSKSHYGITCLRWAITKCELISNNNSYSQIVEVLLESGGALTINTEQKETQPIRFVKSATFPIIREHLV